METLDYINCAINHIEENLVQPLIMVRHLR